MQTHATVEETRLGTAVPEGAPKLPTRVSWGAVLAGCLVALTVGVMLNVLGLAVGATTLDPAVPGESPSASALGLAGGIWLLVANLLALAVGGWVAARLSGTADDTDGVLHGLAVWAIAFLISAVLLGNVVSGTATTAIQGASSIVGGSLQGAGQALGQAAQAVAPQAAGALDRADPQALVQRLQQGLQGGGDPAAMTPDQRRAEIARLIGQRVTGGSFEQGQRDRLVQLAAVEFGIPPQEAAARIDRLEAEAREAAAQAERQARQAAEVASNAAATGAYWIFAAMVLGAVAAVLGARVGVRRAVPLATTQTARAYG